MVFIVPPSGKTLSLDVNPNTTTLHTLKQEIEKFHGIPISHQRLFHSQSLGDNDSLFISSLGVRNYSTLTLHVPFYGGTQPSRLHFEKEKDRLLQSLMKTIKKNPKHSPSWVAAARFEESAGDLPAARKFLQDGCQECPNHENIWLEACRLADPLNAKAVIDQGLKHLPDSVRLWKAHLMYANDQQDAISLLYRAVESCPLHVDFWLKLARLETYDNAIMVLNRAREILTKEPAIWTTAASLTRDVPAARAILQEAYADIPNSEEIWLAAFNLEYENHELERARMVLAKARERGGTERVWMKSAILERELGNLEEERKLLNEGLKQFPSFYKLWLMRGQLEEHLAETAKQQEQPEKQRAHKMEAIKVYGSGLKTCPSSVPLWLSLSNLEEEMSGLSKAREVLTMARNNNPQNPQLWLAAIREELKHGYKKEAYILMAKALQECPRSGILWASSIEMAPRRQQKIQSEYALKRCHPEPHVMAAVGKLFWIRSNVDKARNLLNMAVEFAPDIGDFWALYYKFELQHGTEENQKDVLKRCVAAGPKHGEKWQAISKAVENSHQPTESILKKAVIALGKEENVAKEGGESSYSTVCRVMKELVC